MTWTTPDGLHDQLQRLWERGDLLRAAVSHAVPWPLRLNLKTPTAADLSDRFEAVGDWARAIAQTPQVRIEWRQWNHRVQGLQRLPAAVWLDTLDDALAFIGKARQARRFQALWQHTASVQPALLAWLSKRPLQALDLADRWERLLAVVAWLQAHPRPGVYLRQVDVPGVDSKFIEAHRGVLTELFDLALPPQAIDQRATGLAQFTRRFGFVDKPPRIRFRLLDPALPSLPGCNGLPDISLDTASFAALDLPARHVFITENEINFLAFPPVTGALVVFGAGYGWEALARAAWLHHCALHYWGDIDTHGFAILDRLRSHFPHTVSLLMDRQTLLAHRLHWAEETQPTHHDLPRLTTEEAAVYDDLRFDRLQPRLRLEQERVRFGWLSARLRGYSNTG
ncbi:MAG: Wadjet anti-phage system protein JetD domain-containing protein [Thiomonas sp.]